MPPRSCLNILYLTDYKHSTRVQPKHVKHLSVGGFISTSAETLNKPLWF